MELRINANAVISNKKGQILFIKLKGGPYKDGISIPGGGINPGEFCLETIRREIKEETGIYLNNSILPFGFCELMNTSISKHRIVLLFHSISEGEPIETDEAVPFWADHASVEDGLIPFARESLKIFNEKRLHFTINE